MQGGAQRGRGAAGAPGARRGARRGAAGGVACRCTDQRWQEWCCMWTSALLLPWRLSTGVAGRLRQQAAARAPIERTGTASSVCHCVWSSFASWSSSGHVADTVQPLGAGRRQMKDCASGWGSRQSPPRRASSSRPRRQHPPASRRLPARRCTHNDSRQHQVRLLFMLAGFFHAHIVRCASTKARCSQHEPDR